MEWKEVRLGDVCTRVCSGGTPKSTNLSYYGGKIPWLNTKEIDFNRIYSTEKTITDSGLNNSSAKWIVPNTVTVAMYGATAGKSCIVKVPMTTNQACCNLTINDEVADYEFVYYSLKNDYTTLASLANGGAQQNLNAQIIKDYVLQMPSLADQLRIASILSALDRKIELNNKINADLEEMAQAIFKNWFVDFEPFKDGKFVDSELGMIPEGWKVGKITDIDCLITDYVSNGSFASLKQNVHLYEKKEYAQFIRNTDLKTNTFSVYVDKHSYDFLSKSTLYGNEIIISNVGDVGSVHLCPKLDIPMTLGNNIIMLRPNDKEYNYFLYLWFKYFSGQGLIQGIKGGSAQPKFNKTDFKNLPLLIPSFEIIERSYWIFESIFSILSSNVKENSRLSTLRDTLLPRLMSGEIEVPE